MEKVVRIQIGQDAAVGDCHFIQPGTAQGQTEAEFAKNFGVVRFAREPETPGEFRYEKSPLETEFLAAKEIFRLSNLPTTLVLEPLWNHSAGRMAIS